MSRDHALRLLLVEDSGNDAKLLVRKLEQAGFQPQTQVVDSAASLEDALRAQTWDLVISDYELPTIDAPEVLRVIRSSGLDVPVIVISGKVGEESAVAVMRAGAQDYLTKDRLFRLGEVVRRELKEAAVRREHAATQHALKASEDQLRFALDAAEMGVWDWDIVADRMLWVHSNARFWSGRQGFGGTLEESLKFIVPEDLPEVRRSLDEALSGKRPLLALEYRITPIDAPTRWLDLRGRVFFDERGRALRMAGTFQDITERRELEQQLAHSDKLKTIGQLAGGVAHDFNNLLTVILTYGQLVHDASRIESVRELAGPILEAAERAAALTRQLLVFSQPRVVVPKALDVNDVISGVSKLLGRLLGEHVRLETKLSGEIWRVRVDGSRLEQVLLNLAVNARDAMPNGGVLRVHTRNVPGGGAGADHVLIEVSDTGEGMSPEVQQKAFQAFFTTKPQNRGTGLGLATCQTVVNQAGGRIELESAPGQGATFRVYLPRCGDEVELAPKASVGARRGTAAESILVVEDDALVRTTAERALRAAGFTAVGAHNGEQALRMLEERPRQFQVMVTDIIMPRMGGVELARRVHARFPTLSVLFTSGYSGDAVAEQGVVEHAQVLPKPYTADDLARRVRELLDQRNQLIG